MWNHPATQANIKILASYGYTFVDPISGNLACRTVGVGKMADVPVVHQAIRDLLGLSGEYSGINLLVTAGPTRELIDPVRFISNRSSGKMGYAIAEAAARRGANVTLVSGPTAIPVPSGVNVVAVETAAQMKDAAEAAFADAHMAILTAAVADFRPVHVSNDKAPKSADFDLTLVATPDIAAELGRNKGSRVLVGFAAETSNVREKALAKKEKKNLDWIVANDVSQPGAGFDVDTNIVTVFGPDNQQTELGLATKREIASNLRSRSRPS
jgi:phosphopantothenoylcysteine decarboxylase/phosphopantothenate--cysteine ligase